jgi:hypothetical protein
MSDLEDLERTLRDRLDAIGTAPRAVLLHLLMLPTTSAPAGSANVRRSYDQTFAQLLIDLEESPHSRAVGAGRASGAGASRRILKVSVVEVAATADGSRDVELARHPVVVQRSPVLICQDDVLERLVERLLCLQRLGVQVASFSKMKRTGAL